MPSPSVLGLLLAYLLLNTRFILSNGIPSHVFDDMDEDQWIPSYSKYKYKSLQKPSGRGFIFDRGIGQVMTEDEIDTDLPEVKEEDTLVVPEIEKRRLETIQIVDKLLDSSGEGIEAVFKETIEAANTAIKSPLAFVRLTEEFMQKERGEESAPWTWDALASVCDNWLDALKYTTLDPKCYPIVPDSLMFSSKHPWEGSNIWNFLKHKKEIHELHMDEVTIEPLSFGDEGPPAYVRPSTILGAARRPFDAKMTPKEIDDWNNPCWGMPGESKFCLSRKSRAEQQRHDELQYRNELE